MRRWTVRLPVRSCKDVRRHLHVCCRPWRVCFRGSGSRRTSGAEQLASASDDARSGRASQSVAVIACFSLDVLAGPRKPTQKCGENAPMNSPTVSLYAAHAWTDGHVSKCSLPISRHRRGVLTETMMAFPGDPLKCVRTQFDELLFGGGGQLGRLFATVGGTRQRRRKASRSKTPPTICGSNWPQAFPAARFRQTRALRRGSKTVHGRTPSIRSTYRPSPSGGRR